MTEKDGKLYQEKEVEVRTVKIKMPCPDSYCDGFLEHTGRTFMMSPPSYQHACTVEGCDEKQTFKKVYPYIKHEEINT